MWYHFFDKIYLISLDHCKTDNLRLPIAKKELERVGVPYEIYNAEYAPDGAFGCFSTYQHLFDSCIASGYKNVLIFEDDLKIVRDDFAFRIESAINNLPDDYHTLHLGPNTHCPLQWYNSPVLIQMNKCRSTHAQAYSIEAMKQIASYPWTGIPIDQMIEENLQPQGKCFCTYPLLVTQRNGFSDIDKRTVNMHYIEERFVENTKHLI